jgi:hypothetical protein
MNADQESMAGKFVQPGREEALAQLILGYLAECPQSMDTLEGIAEWWVMRQRIRLEVQAVSKALEQLVAQGVLEEFSNQGNQYYRLKEAVPLPSGTT